MYKNVKKLLAAVLCIATLGSVTVLSGSAVEVNTESSGRTYKNIDWNIDVNHRDLFVTYGTYDQNMRYNQLKQFKKTYKDARLVYSYGLIQGSYIIGGDVNHDGKISPADVNLYIDILNGYSKEGLTVFDGITGIQTRNGNLAVDPVYDVNRDGRANYRDAYLIAGWLACNGYFYSPSGCYVVGKRFKTAVDRYEIRTGNTCLLGNSFGCCYKSFGGTAPRSYDGYGNADKYADAIDW